MAKKQNSATPRESLESVELTWGTRIGGVQRDAGEEVEVSPIEKRQLISAGYVNGSVEDRFNEAEKEQGHMEVLKPAHEREDYTPIEEQWAAGPGTGSADDENAVVAGEEGSNVSGDANANQA